MTLFEASAKADEATTVSEGNTEVLSREDKAAKKLEEALTELSFTVVKQSEMEREKAIQDYSHAAEYVATRTFQIGDKSIQVQIAYTPIESSSQGGVMFSTQSYVDGKAMGGNHDMNSGDFQHLITDTVVCATFGIEYGQLSWKQTYIDERKKINNQLQSISHLSWE